MSGWASAATPLMRWVVVPHLAAGSSWASVCRGESEEETGPSSPSWGSSSHSVSHFSSSNSSVIWGRKHAGYHYVIGVWPNVRLWRNNNRRLPRLQSWDSYFGSWFGFSKGKIVKYDMKPSGSAVLMRRFMFSGESHQEEASSHSCSRGSCGWFIVAPPTRGAHIKTM